MSVIDELARSLLAAADTSAVHPRPLTSNRPITLDEGRQIQSRQLALRQARGEKLVGVKLGLTSPEQRQRAQHFRPSVGFLTDAMICRDTLRARDCLHARVEPEIVARVGRELRPGSSREQIRAAMGSFHAGIEVVDPRYPDDEFILPDALADNSSARAMVVSQTAVSPSSIDLAAETVAFQVGDHPVSEGSAAVVMGDPWIVIDEVLEDLLAGGMTIPEGFVIFTGNLVGQAEPVVSGQTVVARFRSLGELRLEVVD